MLKNIKKIAEEMTDDQSRNSNSRFRAFSMCKKCFTFFYKKTWHFERPDYLDDYADQEIPVKFTECPACLQEERALLDSESANLAEEVVMTY